MNTELAIIQPARHEMTEKDAVLLRDTICKGANPEELKLFIRICNRTGLDPFAKQIYAVKRWNKNLGREEMAAQTSVDGLRLTAQRTGEYDGQEGPYWCGPDGKWQDVWLSDKPPAGAKVGVRRKGTAGVFAWGVARFSAYVQTTKEGRPTSFWARMPEVMIAKVAESLALRKAFPQELSGLYGSEEMDQADDMPRVPVQTLPSTPTGVKVIRKAAYLPNGLTEEEVALDIKAGLAHDPETGEVAGPDPVQIVLTAIEMATTAEELEAVRKEANAVKGQHRAKIKAVFLEKKNSLEQTQASE